MIEYVANCGQANDMILANYCCFMMLFSVTQEGNYRLLENVHGLSRRISLDR